MFLKISLSLISGVLIFLSFPKWNLGFLGWIALVPIFYATQKCTNFKQIFKYCFLTGLTAFAGILYWIIPTFQAAEVSIFIGLLCLISLSSYIALYYAFFGLFYFYIQKKFSKNHILISAAFWVALEFLRNYLFTGFSWGLLGYSQWKYPMLIQMAQWTGIYGVSGMLILSNLILVEIIKTKKIQKRSTLILFIAIIASFYLYQKPLVVENKISIAILQGNIDQYKKWSEEYVQEILNSYADLNKKISAEKNFTHPHLVIWPETAVPGWIPQDKNLMRWIQTTLHQTQTYHLIGAATQAESKNYNSAFLFDSFGKISGRYDKIHLVPFGEFVPFKNLLEQWIPVLNQLGGFDSGNGLEPLNINPSSINIKIGINICYEAIFPERIRLQVKNGADFLVNMTNDGWYLDTAAPEQHFAMNVFRAVENRRSLARAANTGISAIIAPNGQIQNRTKLNEKNLLQAEIIICKNKTFYTQFGDIFAWSCILTILWILLCGR